MLALSPFSPAVNNASRGFDGSYVDFSVCTAAARPHLLRRIAAASHAFHLWARPTLVLQANLPLPPPPSPPPPPPLASLQPPAALWKHSRPGWHGF